MAAISAVAISSGVLYGILNISAAKGNEGDEAAANFEAEQRAAAAARAKDAAWKPVCNEAALLQIGDSKKPGALKSFCLNAQGNILACFAPGETGPKNAPGVRIYSPKGELLKTLPLEIKPGAICVANDGSIFVAGEGRVLKLDASGKVLASANSPTSKETVTISKELEEMAAESCKQSKRPVKDELGQLKESLEKRRGEVTGLTVTDRDLFMAVPAPSDFTYRIYRFDTALQNPKLVVEKLRGCCGQMDVQSHGGNLWIPHNARHAIESRDRDGKELSKFGTAGRIKATDFGGCCEPKNLRVLADGDILAAESGPPTCIKRFSASGKFKEVVALVDNSKGDCVRVAVDVSPDGSRYYMLDTTRDAIRVFARR